MLGPSWDTPSESHQLTETRPSTRREGQRPLAAREPQGTRGQERRHLSRHAAGCPEHTGASAQSSSSAPPPSRARRGGPRDAPTKSTCTSLSQEQQRQLLLGAPRATMHRAEPRVGGGGRSEHPWPPGRTPPRLRPQGQPSGPSPATAPSANHSTSLSLKPASQICGPKSSSSGLGNSQFSATTAATPAPGRSLTSAAQRPALPLTMSKVGPQDTRPRFSAERGPGHPTSPLPGHWAGSTGQVSSCHRRAVARSSPGRS